MTYTGFSNYKEIDIKNRKKAAKLEQEKRGEKFKEYRLAWKNASDNGELPRHPLNLDIELASSCNLRCTMCHQSLDHTKFLGVMPLDLAKKCIREAAKYNVPSIKLNWRGEPTLNPHLPEIASYAKEKDILEIQINTNGLPRDFNTLYKAVPFLDRIIFSVDGHSKKTYEDIRRGGVYEQLMENIHKIVEYNGPGKKPYLRIQMCKQKSNEHEVSDFVDYWSKFVDDVRISDVMNRDGGNQFQAGKQKIVARRRCPQPFTRLVVSDKGKVFACCSDWKESYPVGDMLFETIDTIWNGSKMKLLRGLMESNQHELMAMCKNCPVKESYVFS